MTIIGGADGCKSGWIVVTKDLDSGEITWRVCAEASDFILKEPFLDIVAIDIPIGLPEIGARECDRKARQLLGRGRASSVFPAPIRPVLDARDYREACQKRFEIEEKKISKQTWLITSKIKEVDHILNKNIELQNRVHEIHPEVCFYFMNNRQPIKTTKKSKDGQQERCEMLIPFFGRKIDEALESRIALRCELDDILDAFAALWTAKRISTGESITLPSEPSADKHGLRMEIIA